MKINVFHYQLMTLIEILYNNFQQEIIFKKNYIKVLIIAN